MRKVDWALRHDAKRERALTRLAHSCAADEEIENRLNETRERYYASLFGGRVLDFDIENRPLAYQGADYTTGDITAIAACWVGKPETMRVWLLEPRKAIDIRAFRAMYDEAEMITGHYIRGHDLPVINGAFLENGLPPLGEKMSCDTKNDLCKRKHISASQESIAAMLKIKAPKIHMGPTEWREANRLTPKGVKLTRERVMGDVIQHMAMYTRLVELKWLRPPRMWRP